jgi:hypothetical protein
MLASSLFSLVLRSNMAINIYRRNLVFFIIIYAGRLLGDWTKGALCCICEAGCLFFSMAFWMALLCFALGMKGENGVCVFECGSKGLGLSVCLCLRKRNTP